MKTLLRTFCLLLWPFWASGQATFDLSAMNKVAPERLILVTYRDRTLDRLPPPNGYRRRGPYHNSTWSSRRARNLAEDYHLKPVAQWPITEIGEHCVVYAVPEDQEPGHVLQHLQRDDRVLSVQTMRVFRTQMVRYHDPYFQLQEHLHWIDIESAHRLSLGRGIRIAIIDTIIDTSHPDLKASVALQQQFLSDTPPAEVHGTAMAGIIAAQIDNQTGIVGVAPGARLIALQGCWSAENDPLSARCNTFSLALALNTALKLKPRIINLSLTGPEDPLLRRLVEKAVDEDIIVVAAEPEAESDQTGFPASMPEVIAVMHPPISIPLQLEHCLPAPGKEILTTFPKGRYNFISGSSAATAQISGIIALMLELNPNLKPRQIHNMLLQAIRRRAGQLFVNAHAAVQLALQSQ